VNVDKLKLNLNFQHIVSHADDLRYAGVKVGELEKRVLEHEWREKHSVLHHGYSIALYVFVTLICLYIAIRIILCCKARGACRIVAGALRPLCSSDSNPDSGGLGNVVNINIKTSNESIAHTTENMPLRTLPPSGDKDVESETRASRLPRSNRSLF